MQLEGNLISNTIALQPDKIRSYMYYIDDPREKNCLVDLGPWKPMEQSKTIFAKATVGELEKAVGYQAMLFQEKSNAPVGKMIAESGIRKSDNATYEGIKFTLRVPLTFSLWGRQLPFGPYAQEDPNHLYRFRVPPSVIKMMGFFARDSTGTLYDFAKEQTLYRRDHLQSSMLGITVWHNATTQEKPIAIDGLPVGFFFKDMWANSPVSVLPRESHGTRRFLRKRFNFFAPEQPYIEKKPIEQLL